MVRVTRNPLESAFQSMVQTLKGVPPSHTSDTVNRHEERFHATFNNSLFFYFGIWPHHSEVAFVEIQSAADAKKCSGDLCDFGSSAPDGDIAKCEG